MTKRRSEALAVPGPAASWERNLPWIAALAAIAVSLPAVGGGFVWDDIWLLEKSPLLSHPGSLFRLLMEGHGWGTLVSAEGQTAYYRPVPTLVQGILLILFGAQPLPFRILMSLLHAGTALALGIFLRARSPRAAWGAVLFAVHPVLADAFGWISATPDLMAAGLLVASIVFFLRPEPAPFAGGLFWLLALLSKESAAAGILWFPLIWMAEGRRGRSQSIRRIVAGLAAGALVYVVIRALGPGFHRARQDYPPGVEASGWILSGRLLLIDLIKLVVPVRPSLEPPQWVIARGSPLTGALGVLTGLLLAAGSIALLRRRRTGSAPGALALGTLLCLSGLLPILQVVPSGEVFGGRLLYLPAAGLCIGVGLALSTRAGLRRPLALAGILLLASFALRAGARAFEWRDQDRLFSAEYRRHPENLRLKLSWANILLRSGRTEEARPIVESAVARLPHHWLVLQTQGDLLMREGRFDEAANAYSDLVARGRGSPAILMLLGRCQLRSGRLEDGLATLDQAMASLAPTAGLRNDRGNAFKLLGRFAEARTEYEKAIALDGSFLPARVNLISLLAYELRDPTAALLQGEEFLRLHPSAPEAAQVRAVLESPDLRAAGTGR